MAESATAGLYMSTLFARLLTSIRQGEANHDGFFLSEISHSIRQLSFGRHAVMNARGKLKKVQMIEEVRESRAKSRLLSRINLADLPAQIALQASKYHSMSENNKQVCRNTTFNSSPKRVTRVHQNVKQEFTVPQNNTSPNRATCSAHPATLSYKEINTTYQHLHKGIEEVGTEPIKETPVAISVPVLEAVVFEDLIYPDNLLPTEKDEAIKLISRKEFQNNRHQLVLDEWHGQILRGHVKSSQLGYLRVLVQRESNQELMIQVGHQVQARRQQRQQHLETRMKAMPDQPASTITPEKRMERRNQLTNLRQSLGWK
jgi:hypothetical protein